MRALGVYKYTVFWPPKFLLRSLLIIKLSKAKDKERILKAGRENYHLVGRSILTCIRVGSNVRWDDIIPQCELILCSPPGKIKNGKYTNSYMKSFEYNQFVTYSCNPSDGPEEYSLVGESQLTCSGPDTWSSDPPECKGQNVRKTLL